MKAVPNKPVLPTATTSPNINPIDPLRRHIGRPLGGGGSMSDFPDQTRAQLLAAIDARDADAFELALGSAFQAGLPRELACPLADALLMPWHQRHEDLARAMQAMKDPRSVDALFKAALSQHEYLEYDESFGLARKCTWALADIGTPEAKERLQELARSTNATIAGNAQRRLDRWQEELRRKGV